MPEGQASGGTQTVNPSATPGDAFAGIVMPPAAPEVPEPGQEVPEPGQEGAEGGEQTPPATPPRLFAGRFKSPEELEVAYDETSLEGRRLYEITKSLESERESLHQQIEELSAKLKSKPPEFKELSAEEVKKLRDENPASYTEYMLAKDRYDRQVEADKAEQENTKKAQAAEKVRVTNSIRSQLREMRSKPEEYPDFVALKPVMDALLDIEPELAGRESTPKMLYYAAFGLRAVRAAKAGKSVTDKSKQDAEAQAAAAAGKTGGTGHPSLTPTGKMDDFNQRIINAGKKKLPGF